MEETTPFATIGLPIALALIMITLGMTLVPADFTRVFRKPRGITIGLVNLFLVSPLLAFAIAELFGLGALFAAGLVLLGASPGGTLANLLTHLARGELALSVSMTALSSIAAVVTVPLYLGAAISFFDAPDQEDFSMLSISARVFAITIVPLAIGMYVRARNEAWAVAHEPRAKALALTAWAVVVVGAVASEFEAISEHFGELALAALALNVAAMTVSFFIARGARLSEPQATAVAMELGLHNSTVAIAVGALIDTQLAVPAAVYSAFMFLTGGAFAVVMARRNAGAPQPQTT